MPGRRPSRQIGSSRCRTSQGRGSLRARQARDQVLDGLSRVLQACGPKAVVNVIPPELAIEWVQVVVMLRHGGGSLLLGGDDHGEASTLLRAVFRVRTSYSFGRQFLAILPTRSFRPNCFGQTISGNFAFEFSFS